MAVNGRKALLLHPGFQMYGADRAVLAIARQLAHSGWSVTSMLPRSGVLETALRETGAEVVIMDPLVLRRAEMRTLSRAAWAGLTLKRLWEFIVFAHRTQFDVVHVNGIPVLGGLLIKARRPRTKLVWHVHEILEGRNSRKLVGRMLKTADVIVACSHAAGEQFADFVKLDIDVVPSGARPLSRTCEATVPFTGHSLSAVCVGRLNPWKGQEDLIAAAAILRDAGTELRVELIGDVFPGQEPVRDQLHAQVKALGLEGQVSFLGELDAPEDVVEQADVAVFPSTSPEPFGMALVEAMALGRPVIATDIGGPAEIVRAGTDGYLVPPHAPRAIADAIAAMIAGPEAARAMGEAAVVRAKDFSLDDMARSVERLMGSVGGDGNVSVGGDDNVAVGTAGDDPRS